MKVKDRVETPCGRTTGTPGMEGVIVNMEIGDSKGDIMTVKFPSGTCGVFHESLLKVTQAYVPPPDPPIVVNKAGLKVMEDK